MGTLKFSLLLSASCLWGKQHEFCSCCPVFLQAKIPKNLHHQFLSIQTSFWTLSLFHPGLSIQEEILVYSRMGEGRDKTEKTVRLNANMAFQTTALLIRYLFPYGINPAAYCEFCQNLKGRPPLIGWLQVNSQLNMPAVYIQIKCHVWLLLASDPPSDCLGIYAYFYNFFQLISGCCF